MAENNSTVHLSNWVSFVKFVIIRISRYGFTAASQGETLDPWHGHSHENRNGDRHIAHDRVHSTSSHPCSPGMVLPLDGMDFFVDAFDKHPYCKHLHTTLKHFPAYHTIQRGLGETCRWERRLSSHPRSYG